MMKARDFFRAFFLVSIHLAGAGVDQFHALTLLEVDAGLRQSGSDPDRSGANVPII